MNTVRLIVIDLDGTLIGDDQGISKFAAWYETRRNDCALVYSSGLRFESVDSILRDASLPPGRAVISSSGTQIHDLATKEPMLGWPRISSIEWDAETVRSALKQNGRWQMQPCDQLSPYKVSYYLPGGTVDEIARMRTILRHHGIRCEMVLSGGVYLDVLPRHVNKQFALTALAEHWEIDQRRIVVCGDLGECTPMFAPACRQVAVSSADQRRSAAPDLVYLAQNPAGAGMIEGLTYWLNEAL